MRAGHVAMNHAPDRNEKAPVNAVSGVDTLQVPANKPVRLEPVEDTGKGTEFVMRLPLSTQDEAPRAVAAPDPVGGCGKIMIVDDDPDVGESMVALLDYFGYDVKRAGDLDSAVQVAQAFHPQIVLLDIAMPGTDGYEIARRLRAIPEIEKDTIFIGLSGFGQPEYIRRSEAAGFARHLLKPVDPAELNAVLSRAMKDRSKE